MKGANKRIGLRKPGGVSKYLREATKHPAAATQSSHKLKPGEGKFPAGVYRSTQPAGKEDKNIPPLSQAERMKKMQLLGQVKKMLARLRTASSISHVELLQSWKKSFQADIIEQQSRSQHFRRPVEKLAHKIKKSRIEEIPADVNIHRHRPKGLSFSTSLTVSHQVDIIHKVLRRHGRKVQPKVGWEYNKHQKRLLLGFRHRKLENGWRYFESFKDFFPRHIKPNNHIPDAIFFFLSLLIFMSCGMYIGPSIGVERLHNVFEDLIDYTDFEEGRDVNNYQAYYKLAQATPLHPNTHALTLNSLFMCLFLFIGMVGVYLADQRFHLAYAVGMVITLITEIGVTASSFAVSCNTLMSLITPYLERVVQDYYQKIDAYDIYGNPVMWRENSSAPEQIVKIRTYRAANIMDTLQQNLMCCGVNNFKDYLSTGGIPSSCCTPLWNQNPYCAREIPDNALERQAKLHFIEEGCAQVLLRLCENGTRMMGATGLGMCAVQIILVCASCIAIVLQARQIRQLRRPPHMRFSAGSISQSLRASAGTDGIVKATGVRAANEAIRLNDKQLDHLQQLRRDIGLKQLEEEEQSSSSSDSSGELAVHTVNFTALKNLQDFVEMEDKRNEEKILLDKTVEQFAGRFNIVANKNLENYVSGIFSSTYQNETNAGLEAISRTLEKQFAEHTTDYDWRKLLKKPKKVSKEPGVLAGQSTSSMALPKEGGEERPSSNKK